MSLSGVSGRDTSGETTEAEMRAAFSILKGHAGPRTGDGSEVSPEMDIDEEVLWQHLRTVVALALWAEQIDTWQSEERKELRAVAQDRFRRERVWFEELARTRDPVSSPFRADLARIAVERSLARAAARDELKRARHELDDVRRRGGEPGDLRSAEARLAAAEAAAAEAESEHRLAVFAALTAAVPTRSLQSMAVGSGASTLARLRADGANELKGESARVAGIVPASPTAGTEPAAGTEEDAGRTPRSVPPPSSRRAILAGRTPLLAVLGVVAAGIAVALLALPDASRPGRSSARGTTAPPCAPGVREPDPADRRAAGIRTRGVARKLQPVNVGTHPAALAIGREGVWVAVRQGVALIEPGRKPMANAAIPVTDDPPSPDNAPFSLALSRDRIWVSRRDGSVVSIDRSTRERVGPQVRYGDGPGTVSLAAGAVWVNNYHDRFEGSLTRIDPCTGRLSRLQVGRIANTTYPAFGSLWVTNSVDRAVERIDPRTGRKIASVPGFDDPQDVIAARGFLWVIEYGDRAMQRLDPRRNRKVGPPIRLGPDPGGVAAGGGSLWVAHFGNGTVTRVDLASRTAHDFAVSAGPSPTDAAAGFGRLWFPNNEGETVTPVRP